MSSFTPGPWRINDDQNEGIADDEYHFIAAGDGLYSPPKYKGFEIGACISIEDARLIAAAPDLLEALESIRRYGLDTLSGRADGGSDDREWQREAVNEMTKRARIAIAAATGA